MAAMQLENPSRRRSEERSGGSLVATSASMSDTSWTTSSAVAAGCSGQPCWKLMIVFAIAGLPQEMPCHPPRQDPL